MGGLGWKGRREKQAEGKKWDVGCGVDQSCEASFLPGLYAHSEVFSLFVWNQLFLLISTQNN